MAADIPNLRNNLTSSTPAYAGSDWTENTLPGSVTAAQQTISNAASTATSTRVYEMIDDPKYYLNVSAYDYNRTGVMTLATTIITDNIFLPLPQQMVDTHHVNYSQEELGLLGAGALGALTATPGIMNSSLASLSAQVDSGQTADAAGGILGRSTIQAASSFGPTRSIAQGAMAYAGVAPNQFLTILLKGPSYKKYTFNITISPRNLQQSNRLRDLIKFFNNSMAPSLRGGNLFFGFPKVFKLKMMPNEEYMYKFKPAVLENFSINYTPGGMPAFYKSGAPEAVTMSLSFLELEFWTSGQF